MGIGSRCLWSIPEVTLLATLKSYDPQRHYVEKKRITYNLDPNFFVDIITKEEHKEVESINHNINCHTDGSKLDDNRTGADVFIDNRHNDIAEEAIHLGNNATVFQPEVFAA